MKEDRGSASRSTVDASWQSTCSDSAMSRAKAEWQMIALDVEGEKRVYRIRTAAPKGIKPKDFANCVIIEWSFDEGLPDESTNSQHQAFESLMDPLDDHTKNSLLMHVYTGSGIKEWCYYAKDYDKFMKALNKALAKRPRFPINILHDHDPIWKYWSGIKQYATTGQLKAA
jgi:uncharacterized protein DUF695